MLKGLYSAAGFPRGCITAVSASTMFDAGTGRSFFKIGSGA